MSKSKCQIKSGIRRKKYYPDLKLCLPADRQEIDLKFELWFLDFNVSFYFLSGNLIYHTSPIPVKSNFTFI